MADFAIKMVGLNLLQRNMLRRQNTLKNRRKANAQAVAILDRWVQKNFEGEGKLAMGGKGWRPLSPSTLLAREKGYGIYKGHASSNPRILQNVGNLKTQWKHFFTHKIGKLQSQMDYGMSHHKGVGRLPVRRILPLDRQIKPKLRKHFEWFKRNAIK